MLSNKIITKSNCFDFAYNISFKKVNFIGFILILDKKTKAKSNLKKLLEEKD